MASKNKNRQAVEGSTVVQINLAGLLVFSASLVIASALLTFGLVSWHGGRLAGKTIPADTGLLSVEGGQTLWQGEPPAWGRLITRNIELEKPDEYVAYECGTNHPPTWIFPGMSAGQARQLMLDAGLTASQADRTLAAPQAAAPNLAVQPDAELILGLSPQVRAKLYDSLGQFPENHYQKSPFVFTSPSFDTIAIEHKLAPDKVALIKKLLYRRNNADCLSDIEFLLRQIPDEHERVQLVKVLSSQPATLVRLHIGPDTDVDKLLGYWAAPAAGVRYKDLRPLLDALKRVPEGGSISVLYFMPPFARQRLYTFPMPPKAGDPMMDCHWSTMNFFNETPDDHFGDRAYLSKYVSDHFYEIAKASSYGDVIFLEDGKGAVLHSAVFLADDIVFTKNGSSTAQPWVLMHLRDLMGVYASSPGLQTKVYRNKDI